jgi:hypothetical protein
MKELETYQNATKELVNKFYCNYYLEDEKPDYEEDIHYIAPFISTSEFDICNDHWNLSDIECAMMYDMDKKVVRDWQTYTVDFNFDGKSD